MLRIAIALALLASPTYALSYPKDCKAATLRSAASKGGCTVENGAKHHKVMKDGNVITLIPNTVKSNGTCRSIITKINNSCQ
jgi:hypothetical protein